MINKMGPLFVVNDIEHTTGRWSERFSVFSSRTFISVIELRKLYCVQECNQRSITII